MGGALLAAVALAAPALAAAPAEVPGQRPLRESELTTLSDSELAGRIFGPLAAALVVGPRLRAHPIGRGGEVWFWTRARKDGLKPGICATDRTIVSLEPVPGTGAGGDPGLAIRGIRTDTYFLIANRAFAERGFGFTPNELAGLDAACARLNPRDGTQADSSWQLMKAFELANQLGSVARAGRATFPLDCSRIHFFGPAPASETECLKEISRLGERLVDAVRSCGEGPVLSGACIRIQTPDWFIYVLLDREQKMVRAAVEGIEDTRAIE